jgi:hypothetical protein
MGSPRGDKALRRTIALILVAGIAWGCVATQRRPPATVLSGIRAIAIVAVEAPPLLLHPEGDSDRAAIRALGLTSPHEGQGFSGAGHEYLWLPLLPVIGPVVSIARSPAITSIPRGETATIVKGSPPWMPTTSLARIAARMLQDGDARNAIVIDGYAQLPIADRRVDVALENWMSAERRWYNADESLIDYTLVGAPSVVDAILEVGVSNYEYASFSRLILQVHVKLSDPTTKQVLGRARNADSPKAQPLALMLQDQAQPLRRLIETTGETLLSRCLADLGLIPR